VKILLPAIDIQTPFLQDKILMKNRFFLTLWISVVILSVFLPSVCSGDCTGCCSSHGGVVCFGVVTRCADGSSLSQTCVNKGCNACGSVVEGSLTVTLGPSGAVSAGAQWDVDGGAWQNSGVVVSGLSAGFHTVNYKGVTGWIAPSNESVTITGGQTTSLTGNYIPFKPMISGYVRTSGGTGINSVTVSFSNSGGTATTDSSGYYSNTVSYGWSGSVTPNLSGYTFSPTSLSYTNVTTNQANQDYTGNRSVSLPFLMLLLEDEN